MKFFLVLLSLVSTILTTEVQDDSNVIEPRCGKEDRCVSFHVASGTGCSWMCQYCQDQLGTTNYYFTDGVCKYKPGGCQGNPQLGVEYTCCAGSSES